MDSESANSLDPCGHKFCRACCKEHLRFHIERAEMDKLCCPNLECKQKIAHAHIKSLFDEDEEIVEKFDRFLKKKYEESNPLARWCVKPNCGQMLIGES